MESSWFADAGALDYKMALNNVVAKNSIVTRTDFCFSFLFLQVSVGDAVPEQWRWSCEYVQKVTANEWTCEAEWRIDL